MSPIFVEKQKFCVCINWLQKQPRHFFRRQNQPRLFGFEGILLNMKVFESTQNLFFLFLLSFSCIFPPNVTLFKTEELFLINYPVLLTPDLGCIYYEYS